MTIPRRAAITSETYNTMTPNELEKKRCMLCGEFHDVQDEERATGTGHSYAQVQTIYECDKAQYPDDEAFADSAN